MTDVDSEMEPVADQSAARDVNPAAPTQKEDSSLSHSTPGIHTGTIMGPQFWGLELRHLHPRVVTSDHFPAAKSHFPPASCLNRLPVPETLRITYSSSIPQPCCPAGTRRDMIIITSILLSDYEETLCIFTQLCPPISKTIRTCSSMLSGRATQLMSTF